jgi:hypothetical protein
MNLFPFCQSSRWFRPAGFWVALILALLSLGLGGLSSACAGVPPMTVAWTNNLLTVRNSVFPDGKLEILYLEAFCHSNSWARDWGQTKIPHRTTLLAANSSGTRLKFRTEVSGEVEVLHEVAARGDHLDFDFKFINHSRDPVDIQWFQPACIRVGSFTGADQAGYTARSFVFTDDGLKTLDQLHRTTQARYLGGQVYLPPWTLPADANPRPLCSDRLANGLVGCYSADGRWILATASSRTHELFEGVYVCLHSDPLVDGLKPGETKVLRQKVYILPNDPQALLRRYHRDFGTSRVRW